MAHDFCRAIVSSNRELFTRICRSNALTFAGVHADHWPESLPPAVIQQLLASRRGLRQLSRWLTREAGLDEDGFWEYQVPHSRLVLLDADALNTLARNAGAALCRHQISRIIDRQARVELKDGLKDAYTFAVKRASLVVRIKLEAEVSMDAPLVPQVIALGQTALAKAMHGLSPEIQTRLRLRLPKTAQLETNGVTPDESRQLGAMLVRILLTEISPELRPCFN